MTAYATRTQAEFEPMFAASSPHPGRKPALSDADIAAAREEGRQQGLREAQDSTERVSAEALRAIARMLQMMLGALGAEAHTLRQEAVDLSLAAARAASGRLMEVHAHDVVAAVFEDAVQHLRAEPRLVVRVAPEQLDVLQAKLESVAAEAGFPGQVVVRPDAAAGLGDCVIEWGGGAIQSDREAVFEAVEAAAAQWLSAAEADGLQLDLFQP